MQAEGWRISTAWQLAVESDKDLKHFYSFERDGYECDLILRYDPRTGYVYTTVVHRQGL